MARVSCVNNDIIFRLVKVVPVYSCVDFIMELVKLEVHLCVN